MQTTINIDKRVYNYPYLLIGVGRNKTFRAQARISVSGIRYECAGNATTRYAWVALFRPTPLSI